jgi:hypothetical protein
VTVRQSRPIYAADLRTLGGFVDVVPVRDQDGLPAFRINHVSRGKDLVWLSTRIADEDRAFAGAEVLAEYLGSRFDGNSKGDVRS